MPRTEPLALKQRAALLARLALACETANSSSRLTASCSIFFLVLPLSRLPPFFKLKYSWNNSALTVRRTL